MRWREAAGILGVSHLTLPRLLNDGTLSKGAANRQLSRAHVERVSLDRSKPGKASDCWLTDREKQPKCSQ
jgi:hypothetical protein